MRLAKRSTYKMGGLTYFATVLGEMPSARAIKPFDFSPRTSANLFFTVSELIKLLNPFTPVVTCVPGVVTISAIFLFLLK